MPRGHPSVSKEVKEQILKRIKDDGVPIAQIAQEHGISTKTIYNWLGRGVKAPPSILELSRLKRENQGLMELIGRMTVKLSSAEKKDPDR
jgi:transposase-like protein